MAAGNDAFPLIALTAGEPAGIGPDLCVMLPRFQVPARIVAIGDRTLLRQRAERLGISLQLKDFTGRNDSFSAPDTLEILHTPLAKPVIPGRLDSANSAYVLDTLKIAVDGCLTGTFDAMATAPVHKGIINDAGFPFTGHTEFLADRTGTPEVVMMLVGGGLRVALATTHLALKDVPAAITHEGLTRTLRILHHDLKTRFGLADPRILVAGLNPHAGESGHLGREEIEIITPVIRALQAEGMRVEGPLPADTLFTPRSLADADCAFAMYHDQGLPVLKYASFGGGVNVTLGLPIVRTSVDHGTALDLAGTGQCEIGSLLAAIGLAAELVGSPGERPATTAPAAH